MVTPDEIYSHEDEFGERLDEAIQNYLRDLLNGNDSAHQLSSRLRPFVPKSVSKSRTSIEVNLNAQAKVKLETDVEDQGRYSMARRSEPLDVLRILRFVPWLARYFR